VPVSRVEDGGNKVSATSGKRISTVIHKCVHCSDDCSNLTSINADHLTTPHMQRILLPDAVRPTKSLLLANASIVTAS
jgi:hypothetical protein